jgi:hypothetical protein
VALVRGVAHDERHVRRNALPHDGNALRRPPAAVTNTAVGTASLAFVDARHGTFTYNNNATSRTKAIEREQLASVSPICD